MKELTIRLMVLEDIEAFERGFREQGWNPKPEIHKMYLEEQNRGLRKVFVAEIDGEAAGVSHPSAGSRPWPICGKRLAGDHRF